MDEDNDYGIKTMKKMFFGYKFWRILLFSMRAVLFLLKTTGYNHCTVMVK